MALAATFGTFSLAGSFAGGTTAAEELMQRCGDYSYDMTRSTFVVGENEFRSTVEDYNPVTGKFSLRLSPSDGLPVKRAELQAAMVSDLFCMRLDKLPVAVSAGRAADESWLFEGGCQGHEVRMAEKC